jgi:hypothetical protein
LWMNRNQQDTFVLDVNFLSVDWKPHHWPFWGQWQLTKQFWWRPSSQPSKRPMMKLEGLHQSGGLANFGEDPKPHHWQDNWRHCWKNLGSHLRCCIMWKTKALTCQTWLLL